MQSRLTAYDSVLRGAINVTDAAVLLSVDPQVQTYQSSPVQPVRCGNRQTSREHKFQQGEIISESLLSHRQHSPMNLYPVQSSNE